MHPPVNAKDQRPLLGHIPTNQQLEEEAKFLELLRNTDGDDYLEQEDLQGEEVEDLLAQMTLALRQTA